MKLKIMTLNLWRMYEWDVREPVIVEQIVKHDPDIVLFQEAQLDWRISEKNQVELLNEKLNFPYTLFTSADQRLKQRGEIVSPPAQLGHGALSKYPFKNVEQIFLTQQPDDADRRMLLSVEIEKDGAVWPIMNVHFSNSDLWAEMHLKEAMAYLGKKGGSIILAGDFNIFDLNSYRSIYNDRYTSSADVVDYKSYPSKDGTLDYILLPKQFSFIDLECLNVHMSDHRALIAEIER